jgi:hypothetical protein
MAIMERTAQRRPWAGTLDGSEEIVLFPNY